MTTTPYINGKAQAYPKNFTKIGEEIIWGSVYLHGM
jgi:hypothetical protein